MKPYIFNNNEYTNLNDLGLAYIDNFDLGVKDIYENSKKLVKFVKSQTKNKDRIKNVVQILALSKYKNNALTFLIYEFLDNKQVIIDGQNVTFDDFLILLKNHPEKENNILFAFLADHGITRCFERLEPASPYFRDAYFIESNYDNDFTYLYLTTLKEYEISESLDKKLSSVAIGNEECFRRATKVCESDEFKLWIAHKYGFKEAILMVKERNPLFKALSLLKKEIEEELSLRLVLGTFYWWMFDNFVNYEYKGKAKNIKVRYTDLVNEYKKQDDLVRRHKADKISLDFYLELSSKLYNLYLDFVYFFKEGEITIQKNLDQAKYDLDKPYCKTYITADYMHGKVIKLYTPNQEQKTKYNPLTGEEIPVEEEKSQIFDMDDISGDEPIVDRIDLTDDKVIEESKRRIKISVRFSTVIIIFSLILAGMLIFTLFAHSFDGIEIIVRLAEASNPFTFIGLGAVILAVSFAVWYLIVQNIRENALNDINYVNKASKYDELTLEQEEKLYNLEKNMPELRRKATKDRLIVSIVTLVAFSEIASSLSVIFGALVSSLFGKNFSLLLANPIYLLLSIGAPALLALLFGLIRKKGFWIIFLVFIISIAVGAALPIVL